MEIVNVHPILRRMVTEVVGRTVGDSRFGPASRHEHLDGDTT